MTDKSRTLAINALLQGRSCSQATKICEAIAIMIMGMPMENDWRTGIVAFIDSVIGEAEILEDSGNLYMALEYLRDHFK